MYFPSWSRFFAVLLLTAGLPAYTNSLRQRLARDEQWPQQTPQHHRKLAQTMPSDVNLTKATNSSATAGQPLALTPTSATAASTDGPNSTSGVWPTAGLPAVQCAPAGVALAVVSVPGANLQDHLMRWMAVANHHVYAAQHKYRLYVSAVPLHSHRSASWHKLLLTKAAFQHACPEYVWTLDSDAFFMNPSVSLEAALPSVFSLPSAQRPDVVVAKDCNGINGGSVLFRNSPWALQHLSDLWASTEIHSSDLTWEQEVMQNLTSTHKEVAAHYHIVSQRSINAYPPHLSTCHDASGPYQDGDLMVHFVESTKEKGVSLARPWLNRIPIHPNSSRDEGPALPQVFSVVPKPATAPKSQQQQKAVLTVVMDSALSASERLSLRYNVVPEPFSRNPGWPVRMPKLVTSFLQASNWHRQGHVKAMEEVSAAVQ